MLHINYERPLDSDFQNLGNNLISLISESFPLRKEIFFVKFKTGQEMKIIGKEILVSGIKDVYPAYVSLGYDSLFGTDDSKYGKMNFSNISYIAHTHPVVNDSVSQSRPSGKDVSGGENADYEVTKFAMGVPHYVVSPKYIYCINYSMDEQIVLGNDESQQLVSFAGRWQYGNSFNELSIANDIIYLSDEHFSEEDVPKTGNNTVTVEDDYDLKQFENIKGEMIIDESGNIILQTNE